MKVSVWMVAYNHEPFIAQALEGVLQQVVDFDYEIVIGEDCSTDKTREILLDYKRRFPARIRLLLHDQNVGMHQNLIQTLRLCQGEYIAVLEGDDFWLSPRKLQRQVELLDQDSSLSMCFHEAFNLWPDQRETLYVRGAGVAIKARYQLEDVVCRHFIPTASMLFRCEALSYLPEEIYEIPGFDRMLAVLLAQAGDLAFIDEVWSVRRVHAGGIYAGAAHKAQIKHTLKTLRVVDEYLGYAYHDRMRPIMLDYMIELITQLVLEASQQNLDRRLGRQIEKSIDANRDTLPLTPAEKNYVVSEVLVRLVFIFHKTGQSAYLRRSWLGALSRNRTTISGNRGFWSIGLSALLGNEKATRLRHWVKSINNEGFGSQTL